MDDTRNNFEERRKKIDELFGKAQMPLDVKGRVIAVVVVAIVFITIWFMLDIVIATFILTFVFYHLHKYALKGLSKTPLRILPEASVLALLYIGVIVLLLFFIRENAALLLKQLGEFTSAIESFDLEVFVSEIDPGLVFFAEQIDLNDYIIRAGEAIVTWVASQSTVVLNILLSFILSFLFVLERKKIIMIGDTVKNSRIAYIYRYFLLFFGSFCYTFGKVMKVQIVIAAINCAITATYLAITNFPNIMILSIIIFIFGLIPIAGAFLSLIPLAIVAFTFGGINKVVEILILIAVIHVVEAYLLNPKLMSRRTSLPISLVFVVLIISQRYIGAWGMLIGVPLFIFALNILNIDYRRAVEEESLWKTKEEEGKAISKRNLKKQE